jgi:hypothetical protein
MNGNSNGAINHVNGLAVPRSVKVTVPELVAKGWPRSVIGHVRSIKLFGREGEWFASIWCQAAKDPLVACEGVIGVERNARGNIAVFADPKTGTVRKLGICPARTKFVFRRRRKNLGRAGKTRLLKKLYRKWRRRMSYDTPTEPLALKSIQLVNGGYLIVEAESWSAP